MRKVTLLAVLQYTVQSKINELRGKGSDSPLRGTDACVNESYHLGKQESGCTFILFIFAQRRDKIQKEDYAAEVKRIPEPTGLHIFFSERTVQRKNCYHLVVLFLLLCYFMEM